MRTPWSPPQLPAATWSGVLPAASDAATQPLDGFALDRIYWKTLWTD